jgi:rhamnosyltransferase
MPASGRDPDRCVDVIPRMETNRPPASVVIRNRNERQHLERLLRALSLQAVRPEVVVVDNESTDGSAEMAAASGAKIVPITRSEFTYGRAINVGVANASTEIVIMLSSHSLPLGDRFIEGCLAPFADARVAAVRCIRVERADEWLDPLTLDKPITLDKPWWFWTENNGCAFRKSVWQQIPFDEQIEACEDRLWCYQVLNAGYHITTARAWYRYISTERFWPSVRKYRREVTAIYRMTGYKPPLRFVLEQIFARAPQQAVRTAAHTGLKIVFWAAIAALAPWYARRAPRVGSVR